MGFLHDSPLALSECIFLEARDRTGHSRSLWPGPLTMPFSAHEARHTGLLTVSAACLQQSRRSSYLDVARQLYCTVLYCTVSYTVFLNEFIIRSCAPACCTQRSKLYYCRRSLTWPNTCAHHGETARRAVTSPTQT